MKELNIEAPEGYEIDKNRSTFEKIIFKKKDLLEDLPKSWEELDSISGHFTDSYSKISHIRYLPASTNNKNTFKTREQAEASLALAKLSQLVHRYNDGEDITEENCPVGHWALVIHRYEKGIQILLLDRDAQNPRHFLEFKTKKLAGHFKEHHRDLIEQAAIFLR